MSAPLTLRIATRRSPLAMWQSRHVAVLLEAARPGLEVSFVSLDTHADVRLDVPISELGGKGAFSKEIQARVLAGQADIAVHSAKDLQAVTPEGLVIGAVPERGNPRDALVGARLAELPEGARIATGSNRRRVQLQRLRPDLEFHGLRGNIARRLAQASEFDAIVMAAAALERLEEDPGTVEELPVDAMIPQVGQGSLAIECRPEDEAILELLGRIDHGPSRRRLEVERSFLVELGGDCDLPAGAHAVIEGSTMVLAGFLASSDETTVARDALGSGPALGEHDLGAELARRLRNAL